MIPKRLAPCTTAALLLATLIFSAAQARAAASYDLAWTEQFGSGSNDVGRYLSLDSAGNVYICGETYGSMSGVNAGGADAFLAKYDNSGTEVWTQQWGTDFAERPYSMALDSSNNSFVGGYTRKMINMAPHHDAFLTKCDSSGNVLWTELLDAGANDRGWSVAVDGGGNAYLGGYTTGTLGSTNYGGFDAYVAKYDTNGNKLWTQQLGTENDDWGYSVAADASGGVFLAGHTKGSLGGTNQGGHDAFLAKYDSGGSLQWTRQLGSSAIDASTYNSLAADAAGNVFLCGYTLGDLAGTNQGGYDAYLAKYDAAGNLLWTEQFGTGSSDYSYSVTTDAAGNALLSGATSGSLGGENQGGYDAYLALFDPDGDMLWSGQLGSTGADHGYGAAADSDGNLFLTGDTSYILGQTTWGGDDVFLAKFLPMDLPGDANHDGVVDLADLGILGDNWGGTGKSWEEGDFTGDGVVDLADLGILGDNWGAGATGMNATFGPAMTAVGVPEPSVLAMLAALAAMGLLVRVRQKMK